MCWAQRGFESYPSISTHEEAFNRDPTLVIFLDGIRVHELTPLAA